MYQEQTKCRACGYGKTILPEGIKSAESDERLIPVFDLGIQPLANDFCKPGKELSGFAPLEVLLCPRCNLAQLSVVVRPEVLYKHYCYRTSPSQTMLNHFEKLTTRFQNNGGMERILEIGSNDGRFLSHLKHNGAAKVCGIDPASNLADIAVSHGVPTIDQLFNRESASRAMLILDGKPDAIVARHVFCHIDNWKQFIKDLAYISKENTKIYIEVPWVKNLLRHGEYDTIYHEHTSYLSIKSMEALLKDSGFCIYDITEYDIHGGSLLITLASTESDAICSPNQQWLDDADTGKESWTAFSDRAKTAKDDLIRLVKSFKMDGKRIVGFGASAKSTVIINACRFNKNHIDFICDCTPEKQWSRSPGSGIPIVDEGALLRELPDYAICFCWNFLPEVLEKNRLFIEKGGKFIVPVPDVKIVP